MATAPEIVQHRIEPGAGVGRLASLDAFRGMTIAGMIVVNNPGTWSAVYPPLLHAPWHGWTHTDLVFPFFLFIAGVSMHLSFAKRVEAGASKWELWKHAATRAAIIFAIGIFLNGFPYFELSRIRIPGVLQRIALCYLAGSAIYLLVNSWAKRAIVTLALCLGYWAAMMLVPVPGFGAGNLNPGQDLGSWIDRALMSGHLWRGGFKNPGQWDPEGLLSTIPATATLLLGTFAGQVLLRRSDAMKKIQWLVIAGVAGLALGKLWGVWFPINKSLWTSSYVLFTAGYAALVLAACYWLMDVKKWRGWAKPFTIFGTNAIVAFVLSTWMVKTLSVLRVPAEAGWIPVWTWLWRTLFAPLAGPVNALAPGHGMYVASLMFALAYTGLWLGVCWVLWRKKIFVRI